MKSAEQQIEIAFDKSKLILMLIGAIGFVLIGFWFVLSPPAIRNPVFGNPVFLFIAGLASIVFFSVVAFSIAIKLKDKKPGLIINQQGIVDNSSGLAAGEVLWTDIKNISVIEIHTQKLIMLHVKNPQDYIDRQKSLIKRKGMEMNVRMYGTPLSITANGLKMSFDKLFKLINDSLNASRQ